MDHEKNARDAATAALKEGADADKLAAVALQQVSGAARAASDAKGAVVAAVRGAMTGVFLGGADVVETAMKTLEGLPNISLMMRAGPEELMSWVMEGIADVTPTAGAHTADTLETRIEEKFMGAGAVFRDLCRKAQAKPS